MFNGEGRDDSYIAMRVQLRLQVREGATREVEAFVQKFAVEQGLATGDKVLMLIVIEELLTNLQRYGYPDKAVQGSAEIALNFEGGRLAIEFIDDGQAFDPLAHAAPDLDAPLESRTEGGLGLLLVRRLVDDASYQRIGARNCTRLSWHVATAQS
ncbi:MAG TPA: ATP-binding protein [Candidatus Binataceae bacterium]|nr:ATP-binding protein [Candidatus Binataceae bacterium]